MPGYKKISRIGSGGQANIWKGKNIETGEIVALKYLSIQGDKRTDVARIEEERARFIREVRIQKTLTHPNILPVLDYADRGYHQWYAMPLADESLADYMRRPDRTESEILRIIHGVIDGIEYAHSRGVIHRDIKPSNILHVNNEWLISDFGFSRDLLSDSALLTRAHEFLGTPYYAAPEQYDDAHSVGPAADIYAIGKTFLACLTGKHVGPYMKLDAISLPFANIIRRCAAEDPAARYQDVVQLREELIRAASNKSVS